MHPPKIETWPQEAIPKQPDEPPQDLIVWQNLPILVQHLPGSVRHPGTPWQRAVPETWRGYGEIAHVPAPDGDDLDVVLGQGDLDGPAWIIWQLNPYRARAPHRARAWARQPKLFLGFERVEVAEEAFRAMWPGHRDPAEAVKLDDGAAAAAWIRRELLTPNPVV